MYDCDDADIYLRVLGVKYHILDSDISQSGSGLPLTVMFEEDSVSRSFNSMDDSSELNIWQADSPHLSCRVDQFLHGRRLVDPNTRTFFPSFLSALPDGAFRIAFTHDSVLLAIEAYTISISSLHPLMKK